MLIEFWYKNLDLVYFFDGLAFVAMALIIAIQLRMVKSSEYRFSRIIWLLALFGLVHSVSVFIDMFSWSHAGYFYFRPLTSAILALSFFIIFLFGFNLVNLCQSVRHARMIGVWFLWLVAGAFLWLSVILGNNPFSWGVSSRYLLGFVGEVLSAIGFFYYYRCNREKLDEIAASRFFIIAAFLFAVLAVLEGLIVPRADFFPASVINTKVFLDVVGIPIQAFRALLAIGIAWSVWNISGVFNAESSYNLMRQKRLLWESETKARSILDSIPLGILITNPEGKILDVNSALRKMLGFEPEEEFSSLNIQSFYTDPELRKQFMEKLNFAGAVKDQPGEYLRKDGSRVKVITTSVMHSLPDGEAEIITTVKEQAEPKTA